MSGSTMMYQTYWVPESKLFYSQQNIVYPDLLDMDQQVPSNVATIKTEVKTEDDCGNSQNQIPNFLAMGEPATFLSSTNTTIIGSTNTSSINSFCRMDSLDTLNTPTPFCNNSINGLKWEPSSLFSSNTTRSSSRDTINNNHNHRNIMTDSVSVNKTISPFSSPVPSPSSTSVSQATPMLSSTALPPFSILSGFTTTTTPQHAFTSTTPPPSTYTSPSQSSTSRSPTPTGPFLTELVAPYSSSTSSAASSTAVYSAPSKTSTFITNEIGGSGCILLSSDLNETSHQVLPDARREYTDLDNQSFSLFSDDDSFSKTGCGIKQQQPTYQEVTSVTPTKDCGIDMDDKTMQTFHLVKDTWMKDTQNLNIPCDPMLWTANHVQKWVSHTCQRYNAIDISSQLFPLDGPELFSMSATELELLGEPGGAITIEMDFYRAASSLLPNESSFVDMAMDHDQLHTLSPSVSPAPSYCSNSQGSTVGISTLLDSDDECDSLSNTQHSALSTSNRNTHHGRGHKQSPKLWEFLRDLLLASDPSHTDCIRWVNMKDGIFKIEDSKKVAYLWGKKKNRPMMNYDKLSRSIRQYYKKKIIKKTDQSKRLVYQFCPGYL